MYWRDGALPLQGLQATQSVQRSAVVQSMLIKDQLIGPRAPGMRPSMDPLEAGHGLVLPSGEKSTLSLSATMLSVTVLSATVLSKTILSETVLSAIALLPRSSLVLLVFSIPPALMQGHLFDVHSPPLVPHVFPAQVLAILWVLLTVVHGLVIVARTLLAIICHLSITRVLVNVACILATACLLLALVCVPQCIIRPPPASPHVPPPDRDFPSVQGLHHDRPEPENAMLEDQAPEAQTVSQLPGPVSSDHDHDTSMQVDARQVGLPVSPKDSPIIPSSEFDDLDIRTDDNGQPGTEITGDVNIREVFERLSEDHLFGVRVQKNKGGKGLARLKKKVMLAFKSQPRWDAVLSRFRNSPGSRLFDFEEATEIAVAHQESIASFRWVLDPDYVEMCYAHQQSADDLTLMLENAPPAERSAIFACFISFHPHLKETQEYRPSFDTCTLDRVEFTTAWFLATLDQEYDVIRRRLKMINLLAFWVPLYITHGLYDVLLQAIKPYRIPDPPIHAVWKPLDSSTPKSGSLNGTHPLHTPPSF
ncbi:hypothetical protein BS47DRAFT_1368070 [Hydnum rufescens UP504]|uniref:Uncharacterized protein n=1 Tax=Hydnum rufescens UP504 TaxID=1448309 RepID=A0A9P6DP90_9AGAM|nr:hypothetical protein BS47DRAFT_1368070 [Hydnum rufescens UP504]